MTAYFISLPIIDHGDEYHGDTPEIWTDAGEEWMRANNDGSITEFYMLDKVTGDCLTAADCIEGGDPKEEWWPMRHWGLIVPDVELAMLVGLRFSTNPVEMDETLLAKVTAMNGQDDSCTDGVFTLTYEEYKRLFPRGWFPEEWWEEHAYWSQVDFGDE